LHIHRKIDLGFGLTVALLVAISVISYRSMTSLVETAHSEVHTHEVLNQLDDVLVQIQNAETGQRGYLLTGEARSLEPYDTALARIHEELAKRRRLVIHAEDGKQASAALLEAARMLAQQPEAMQLRYLQTVTQVAGDRGATIVFPLPTALLDWIASSAHPRGDPPPTGRGPAA
jgi:CHASE3 domain sensor protein